MKTEASVSPSLAALPWETQVNALVAETQGWKVRFTDEEDAPEYAPGDLVGLPPDWNELPKFFRDLWGDDDGELVVPDAPETADWTWIPRYVRDPAAWGAAMERERVGLWPLANEWRAVAPLDGQRTALTKDVRAQIPGEAVALAICAKHGITPPERPA